VISFERIGRLSVLGRRRRSGSLLADGGEYLGNVQDDDLRRHVRARGPASPIVTAIGAAHGPPVAARPFRIPRPFSTVMTSDRLSSPKAPTFSRASGMVLIPPAGSKRGLGLIGRLTVVAGRGSSLSAVMSQTAAVDTSWPAMLRSLVASAMLVGFAINMLPASNMLSRLSGPSAVTVSRRGLSARMILRLVGWQ
jgi:hypothetical protein